MIKTYKYWMLIGIGLICINISFWAGNMESAQPLYDFNPAWAFIGATLFILGFGLTLVPLFVIMALWLDKD